MIQQLYHNPDIYQIHVDLPDNPLKYLNSYVVKGPTRHLVIDTGFNRPECQAALCGGLRELDVDLSRTDLFSDPPPWRPQRPRRLVYRRRLPRIHE